MTELCKGFDNKIVPFKDLSDKNKLLVINSIGSGRVKVHRSNSLPMWITVESDFYISFNDVYKVEPEEEIPDQIDWSAINPKFSFMVRLDNCGLKLCFYSEQPTLKYGCDDRYWDVDRGAEYQIMASVIFASYKQGNAPWQESLIERPEGV